MQLERRHSSNSSSGLGGPQGRIPPAMDQHSGFDSDDSRSSTSSLTPQQKDLDRRTLAKLDFVLLPFLSLLFLLNHLDKSNVGNAEAAHFTADLGLPPSALNKAVACFWAIFVAVQPLGAALGRKFGMARWVPACMALWGVCTALHIAVRHEWQLISLRALVAILEAGFYPTTVSYLSLFYTRYEFAKRLGIFYGQSALAGAMGGLLSWAVFKNFTAQPTLSGHPLVSDLASRTAEGAWKSWEVLFVLEGASTVVVALIGFFWLPHSAGTAWFFTLEEAEWAETRIRLDRSASTLWHSYPKSDHLEEDAENAQVTPQSPTLSRSGHDEHDSEDERLLSDFLPEQLPRRTTANSHLSTKSLTADSGLTRRDIASALLDWKVWFLLVCNVLSAIPTTAFAVFLPLVIKGLTASDDGMTPARANLLAIPPFLGGAVVLLAFTWYSDRTHKRMIPILYGLAILLVGLTATIMLPASAYAARYVALIVLLSGSFIASPLTVAWLTNNIPEPGKRAIVLGINGWGNLAGVFSALLFSPKYEKQGYVTPFYVTTICVLVSFVGYITFRTLMVVENSRRKRIVRSWSSEEVEREALLGDVSLSGHETKLVARLKSSALWATLNHWTEFDGGRRGDEKMTFRYGL